MKITVSTRMSITCKREYSVWCDQTDGSHEENGWGCMGDGRRLADQIGVTHKNMATHYNLPGTLVPTGILYVWPGLARS